jgi:putative FmdB family regulatory protein
VPIYDYTCRQCGEVTEVLVRPGSAAPACSRCSSSDMERLPSVFAVSTDSTRSATLKKARAANLPIERDKAIAQEEYVNKHHD